jgi:hypothetical protein
LGSLYLRALLGFHNYAAFETEIFFSLFMYHYPDGLVARENAQELI